MYLIIICLWVISCQHILASYWLAVIVEALLSTVQHNQSYLIFCISYIHDLFIVIKTHGSESRGQEEAACTRVFWPT